MLTGSQVGSDAEDIHSGFVRFPFVLGRVYVDQVHPFVVSKYPVPTSMLPDK